MSKNNLLTLFFFSNFFFTVKIMLSPAYILPVIIIILYYILNYSKIKIDHLFVSLITFFIIAITSKNLNHPATILALISIISIPFILNPSNLDQLTKISPKAYLYVLIFFSVETLFRIISPTTFSTSYEVVNHYLKSKELDAFYAYKFGSFSFVDSNLTAICLLILLGLGLNLYKKKIVSKSILIFNIILIILTFSRSAYIGSIVLLLLTENRFKQFKLLSIPIALGGIVFFLTSSEDISLKTKFLIYYDFFELFRNYDLSTLLLGNGFGWFIDYHGRAAHSIIVQSIIEGGIIFTCILFYTFYKFGIFSDKNNFYTFISVLISSLSVSVYVFFPAWFMVIAINSNINKKFS